MNLYCPFTTPRRDCTSNCALYIKELDCCSFRVTNQIISNFQAKQINKTEERINYLKSKLCDLDKI